jgi:CheY-like chemotaxis protein
MSALRKVLVVDDDPVVGRSFDRVLSGKGYVVVTAENGQEALNRLGKEEYDLVFTDIRMPGMNGLEVAEQVKARRPWVPVVIVTGYGSDAHEARAEAAGVAGFLNKPLSPEMIEYSARRALTRNDAAAAPEAPPVAARAVPQSGARKASALKNVALFFVSPFVGLAYIVLFPFIGLAMLAWMGVRALAKRPGPE